MDKPEFWRGRKIYYGGATGDKYPRVYWPNHPMAGKAGLVRIHRIVMMEKLGRVVLPKEHVHHIDQNVLNYAPENLALLTPTEHAHAHSGVQVVFSVECSNCGEQCAKTSVEYHKYKKHFCSAACHGSEQERIKWPSTAELLQMVQTTPYETVAKQLGVNSNTIRKRLKRRGVQPPRKFKNHVYVDVAQ